MFVRTVLLVVATTAFAGPEEMVVDNFATRTITELIASETEELSVDENYNGMDLNLGDFRYKSIAVFTGNIRVIEPGKQFVFAYWLSMMNSGDTSMADLYQQEAQFEENGYSFWMPMQRGVISYLLEEVQPGNSLVIYYFYVGCNEGEWVFYNCDYQAL
jgi:hypothetical protein